MHLSNWRDQVAVHDSEEFINEENWEKTNGCIYITRILIKDKGKLQLNMILIKYLYETFAPTSVFFPAS